MGGGNQNGGVEGYRGHLLQKYIKNRLKAKKLVFIYSERWHKNGFNPLKLIKHIPVNFFKYNRFKLLRV